MVKRKNAGEREEWIALQLTCTYLFRRRHAKPELHHHQTRGNSTRNQPWCRGIEREGSRSNLPIERLPIVLENPELAKRHENHICRKAVPR